MRYHNVLLGLLFMATSAVVQATPLEVYQRCYTQITSTNVAMAAARTAAVINGDKTPGEACEEVLALANLRQDNGRLTNENNLTKGILKTFNDLHASWFTMKDIPLHYGGRRFFTILNVYDTSTPAFYFTRTLFDRNIPAEYVLKGQGNIRAVRTDNNPANPLFGGNGSRKDNTIFKNNIRFAPKGELLGITPSGNMQYSYEGGGSITYGRTYGTGVLGNPVYIMRTAGELEQADGGNSLPRTWARDMFKDLLCRDLPVIRPMDSMGFVRENSPIAFRQSNACVVCHASIDRAASTIRKVRYRVVGTNNNGSVGSYYLANHATDLPSENGWPATRDNNYHRRPPKGNLYYRSFSGQLVNVPVNNLNGLSNALAARDDFYVCAAKRYYEYFTGYQVNINDLNGATLSDEQTRHRNRVIGLGRSLRNHQNMKRLIGDILKSPEYTESVEGN